MSPDVFNDTDCFSANHEEHKVERSWMTGMNVKTLHVVSAVAPKQSAFINVVLILLLLCDN